MGGKFGVENLKRIAGDLAKTISVVYKVVAEKSFFALLSLVPVLFDLRNVDFGMAKDEALELDAEDRSQVLAAFTGGLELPEPALSKVKAALSTVDDVFILAAEVAEVVTDVKALVQKLRNIFGF